LFRVGRISELGLGSEPPDGREPPGIRDVVHSCTPHRIRASQDALAPLRETISEMGVHRLARAIRSAVGIEALVWLTDVAGLSREEAAGVMLWSARAMLRSAHADGFPATSERAESGR
jgi:hypothetical protein